MKKNNDGKTPLDVAPFDIGKMLLKVMSKRIDFLKVGMILAYLAWVVFVIGTQLCYTNDKEKDHLNTTIDKDGVKQTYKVNTSSN